MGETDPRSRARVRGAVLQAIGLLLVASAAPIVPTPARAADPPSIVVINTDDQRWDTLWAMPNVQALLAARGVTFTNAFVSNTLCCPSRTSLLTGRYSHSTGVWRNEPPYGGFPSFDDGSTVATWLQGGGYRTALIGKYLNRYQETARQTRYVPPGWDRWVTLLDPGFYDYDLLVDGAIEPHGTDPADYSTDVLAGQATSFIRETAGPLFLYFTPYAPHAPAVPALRHEGAFAGVSKWRPASYNERDVSDKPSYIRSLRLSWKSRKTLDRFRIRQLESLLAVDEAVASIVAALAETGRLETTLIVFTSDNGVAWGEHRWKKKRVPYESSIRVPFVVRYDPLIAEPRSDTRFVMNIDIAPTAAELAGVEAPGVEGRSFLPLLADPAVPGRRAVLIERLRDNTKPPAPSYCALRNRRFLYVVYETREQELYVLRRDPDQLENVAYRPRYRDLTTRLRARLRGLCDPPPPGMPRP